MLIFFKLKVYKIGEEIQFVRHVIKTWICGAI